MSASISPTRCPPPRRASATARFAETVDLPTPPLPDEIARTAPRWGSSTGVGGGGTPPGPGRGAGWRGAAPSAALLASVTLTRTPEGVFADQLAGHTNWHGAPGGRDERHRAGRALHELLQVATERQARAATPGAYTV